MQDEYCIYKENKSLLHPTTRRPWAIISGLDDTVNGSGTTAHGHGIMCHRLVKCPHLSLGIYTSLSIPCQHAAGSEPYFHTVSLERARSRCSAPDSSLLAPPCQMLLIFPSFRCLLSNQEDKLINPFVQSWQELKMLVLFRHSCWKSCIHHPSQIKRPLVEVGGRTWGRGRTSA